MECHIEQVLYRDQRTIKTRFFDVSERQNHQPCLTCQNHHRKPPVSSEDQRFHPLLSQNHHQESSCSKLLHFDDAFRIHGGASISHSSLDNYNNCHNQYFSKNKRLLYRTDNECRCEDVKFSRISEGRRRGVTSWFKKLQNVLLLSTYLSLLTLPNTHALPTKMCNRPSDKIPGFWVNPCGSDFEPSGEPPSEMNVTSVNITIRSATSALISAKYLKEKFRNQTIDSMGSDPEILYSSVAPYDWLPQLPKISSDEEFKQHLSSLQFQWQETLLTLFKHLQTISVPLEQLIIDFNRDPYEPLGGNFSQMEGLIRNVLCELHDSIADNNLKVKENVTRNIMPSSFRNLCDSKTDRNARDWIILRELVNVLEYTVAVCKYLAKGKTDGNHA